MGKIVNSTYMTVDGDITNMQDWHFEAWNDEAAKAAGEIMGAPEALIMGRKTYDGFFPAWSAQSGAESGADRMNSIRKYVVSNTLTDPEWNNTSVIGGDDVAGRIRALKEGMDGDLLQYGFGDVTRLMLAEGLLDQLKLWLHPVFSGNATADERISPDMPQVPMRLTDTHVHSSGMVILSYDILD
jgi:dihydrofolate reductase